MVSEKFCFQTKLQWQEVLVALGYFEENAENWNDRAIGACHGVEPMQSNNF